MKKALLLSEAVKEAMRQEKEFEQSGRRKKEVLFENKADGGWYRSKRFDEKFCLKKK